MKKMILCLFVIAICCVPTSYAHTKIAVYGQCVNAIFDIVPDQIIDSFFYIRAETGSNITIETESIDLKVNLSKSSFTMQDNTQKIYASFELSKEDINETIASVNFTISSGFIFKVNESITATAIKFLSYFQINTIAHLLKLQIIDQFSIPYVGANVMIQKGGLIYRTKKTYDDGSVFFVVARGNYSITIKYNDIIIHKQDMQVMRDRNEIIYIPRQRFASDPPSFPIVFIIGGIVIGYGIRYLQNWKEARDSKAEIKARENK